MNSFVINYYPTLTTFEVETVEMFSPRSHCSTLIVIIQNEQGSVSTELKISLLCNRTCMQESPIRRINEINKKRRITIYIFKWIQNKPI